MSARTAAVKIMTRHDLRCAFCRLGKAFWVFASSLCVLHNMFVPSVPVCCQSWSVIIILQVLANGDVNSPAVERMTQLVQECLSLSAGVAIANPRGFFTFSSLKMDAAAPSTAEPAPGQDFWARIVVSEAVALTGCDIEDRGFKL